MESYLDKKSKSLLTRRHWYRRYFRLDKDKRALVYYAKREGDTDTLGGGIVGSTACPRSEQLVLPVELPVVVVAVHSPVLRHYKRRGTGTGTGETETERRTAELIKTPPLALAPSSACQPATAAAVVCP